MNTNPTEQHTSDNDHPTKITKPYTPLHSNPMVILDGRSASAAKINNEASDVASWTDRHPLAAGLSYAVAGGCRHDAMDRTAPVARDVHGEVVGRICPTCGRVA